MPLVEDQQALEAFDLMLRTVLPEQYQDSYEDIQPVSMGSASLKYADDGRVAWDDIWGSFCDLAMAGGPPHKGRLLEPATRSEVESSPEQYQRVAQEICRGITLVTDLPAALSQTPGWIQVQCPDETMAGWLTRAIVMENISVRWVGTAIELPAGPAYRIEKEIKNVITSIAKTCHYWVDHMWLAQQRNIAALFARMAADWPLIQPTRDSDPDSQRRLSQTIAAAVQEATGIRPSDRHYNGWLGIECPDVRSAVWLMRGLIAGNILSRREEKILFVPVNPATDPEGEGVIKSLLLIYTFARARGVL
jgi:hypothetical protein